MPILILSEKLDYTTHRVVEWVKHFKSEFLLVNKEDAVFFSHHISNNCIELFINRTNVTKNIKNYWFRRGNFPIAFNPFENIKNDFWAEFKRHLNEEFSVLQYSISQSIEKLDNSLITRLSSLHLFKIPILEAATEVGLLIPDTLVSNSKSEILTFLEKNGKCITKSISESFTYSSQSKRFLQYTTLVDYDFIEKNFDEYIFPSIFQRCIDKIADIRVFILNSKIYSMAIFSQNSQQTKIDFRNYDLENENRTIPFKLPSKIERTLLKLMKKLDLNSASVDFVYSTDKKIYFLEINPFGQFGMVSTPCNYYLERKIAQHLSK